MLEVKFNLVAGIDVHTKTFVVSVLWPQSDGTMIPQTKTFVTFRRGAVALAQWLKSLKIDLAVMESTGVLWRALYHQLELAGVRTWVVNAFAVRHVPGRKTDVSDSMWLATVGRFGLVKASFIPPKEQRELRLVSRYRAKLIQIRASETNRMHKFLDDAGIKLGIVVSDLTGVSADLLIEGLLDNKKPEDLVHLVHGKLRQKTTELLDAMAADLSETHRFLLRRIRNHSEYLSAEILALDTRLMQAMEHCPLAHALLQTLPGVSSIAAAQILIEMGDDMSVFQNSDRLAAWACMCPGNNESAGKRKTGKTRHGLPMLRFLLCECAHAAAKTQSSLRGWFQAMMQRKNYKKSIIALGHRLLRIMFSMLRDGTPYRDPKIDYEAMRMKKNAPRYIRQLKRIGRWPEPANTALT